MRHIKTKTAQIILLAGISLFAFCTSALADIDWKRMKRDLSIQESILDQFFDEKKVSTTGLYIENHGVLLIASGWMQKYEVRVRAISKSESIATPVKGVIQRQMDRGDRVLRIQKIKRDKNSENEEEEILEFPMTAKKPETSQSQKKEQNEAIKKQITEFLSLYGNTIGQLKDDDRITILLHSAERYFHSFSSSHFDNQMEALKNQYEALKKRMETLKKTHASSEKQMEEAYKKQLGTLGIRIGALQKEQEASKNIAFKIAHPKGILLEATVTKRDIDAYNRGKIDEQTFHNRITFREHKPQPARDKTIDIMADILTTILKKDTDLHFLSDTKSSGFYQKGIGALFLTSQKDNLFGYDWYKRESGSNRDDKLDAFKTAVIATLADYGPTLRGLSSEESIIVHTNLIGDSHFKIGRTNKDKTTDIQHPDRILFRVAKRDINAYASQKIDLDTFRKRVAITEM